MKYKLVIAVVILLVIHGCEVMGMAAKYDVLRTDVSEGTLGHYIEAPDMRFEHRLKLPVTEGRLIAIHNATGFELKRVREVAGN